MLNASHQAHDPFPACNLIQLAWSVHFRSVQLQYHSRIGGNVFSVAASGRASSRPPKPEAVSVGHEPTHTALVADSSTNKQSNKPDDHTRGLPGAEQADEDDASYTGSASG